jgi:hypothetical protein
MKGEKEKEKKKKKKKKKRRGKRTPSKQQTFPSMKKHTETEPW